MFDLKKVFGLTLFMMLAFGALSSHKVFAAGSDCDMLVPTPSGPVAANCINYVNQANTANVSTGSGLVSALEGDMSSGIPADVTSSNWIVNQISPDGSISGLQRALAQSNVSVSVVPLATIANNCNDSGYNPVTNGIDRFTQCDNGGDSVLLITQNGRQILALRRLCGNALGSTARLTQDTPPTGSISLACNTIGTGAITISFSDADGNTHATLTVQYASGGTGTFVYGSSGTYSRTLTAPEVKGTWYVSLFVYDNGGNQNVTVTNHGGNCDRTPTGSFGSMSCNPTTEEYTISASWGDANGPTQAELTDNAGRTPAVVSGSSDPTRVGSTSGTWVFKTTSIPPTEWPVHLKVQDSDGGVLLGYVNVANYSPEPNCNPVGSINVASNCYQVSLKLWDPNTPTNNVNYYLSVNGTRDGVYTFNNGQNGATITRSVNSLGGFNYWGRNSVQLIGVDSQTGGQVGLGTATLNTICGSVSCGISTMPGTIVAGEQVKFQVTMNVHSAAPVLPPTGPPGATFNPINFDSLSARNVGYAYSGGVIYSNRVAYTPPASGYYTVSWTFAGANSNPTSVSCNAPAPTEVAYEPYFDITGGDIAAGPGFGNGSCTQSATPAAISAYNINNTTGDLFFGSGSQLGAFANGKVTSFVTDHTNNIGTGKGVSTNLGTGVASPGSLAQPSGLAFANTTASGSTYGGGYNDNAWCVPDYAQKILNTSPATAPASVTTSGVYYLPPGTVIGSGGPAGTHVNLPTLTDGMNITLVSDGDVYINQNVQYAYTDPTRVPQLMILTKGNIFISSAVTTLTGVYDAQPGGTHPVNSGGGSGNLYTCASPTAFKGLTGDASKAGSNMMYVAATGSAYSSCSAPLTVYGSVSAAKLTLGRTYGNLAAASDTGSNNPAENFVYTPEMWLGNLTGPSCQTNTVITCEFQAYTTLPPVF